MVEVVYNRSIKTGTYGNVCISSEFFVEIWAQRPNYNIHIKIEDLHNNRVVLDEEYNAPVTIIGIPFIEDKWVVFKADDNIYLLDIASKQLKIVTNVPNETVVGFFDGVIYSVIQTKIHGYSLNGEIVLDHDLNYRLMGGSILKSNRGLVYLSIEGDNSNLRLIENNEPIITIIGRINKIAMIEDHSIVYSLANDIYITALQTGNTDRLQLVNKDGTIVDVSRERFFTATKSVTFLSVWNASDSEGGVKEYIINLFSTTRKSARSTKY